MNLTDFEIEELLKQWGAWSRTGLGASSLEQPVHDNSHWINDDIGLKIDKSIASLKTADQKRSPKSRIKTPRYMAVILYYKECYNIPMLANALNCGKNKATILLKSGEAFVESALID